MRMTELRYKKSICIFILSSFSFLLYAQDQCLNRNYMSNGLYNINPAAAGFDGAFISELTGYKKWMGLNGSPAGQVLSNSLKLGSEGFYDPDMFLNRPFFNIAPRVGIGFTIFNESSGPLRHTGLLLAYAYHIPIKENHLSFGLSGLITQHYVNTREFKAVNEGDAALYSNATLFVPNLNFGVMFYNRKLFIGMAVDGLLNYNSQLYDTKTSPDIVFFGGNKFIINQNFTFEPSTFLWKYEDGTISLGINSKLYYSDKNWALVSYTNKREILAGIGITIKSGIQLNYIYTTSTAGLSTYSLGKQSISIRVDITTLVRKQK